MKWYHDSKGKPSTMRIITMVVSMTGVAIAISATVAMFLGFADAVSIGGLGAALALGSEGAKGWQSSQGG